VWTGDKYECGVKLSAYAPGCEVCSNNDGLCYDLNDDGVKDGCSCPVSRTGEDCAAIHANVTCIADPQNGLSIQICYKPHDGVDFSASSQMYAEQSANNPDCVGVEDTEGVCPHASRVLTMALSEERREACNIKKIQQSQQTNYESRIYVTTVAGSQIIFDTFCTFQTNVDTSSGVGTIARSNGEEGLTVLPNLVFDVRRTDNSPLQDGESIDINDEVRIYASLQDDDNYGALRVENCLFSNKQTIPGGNNWEYMLILRNSCPTDTNFLNPGNTFEMVKSNPKELRSGKLKFKKFSTSFMTYLICEIKVCLNDRTDECETVLCGPESSQPSLGRRKRAVQASGSEGNKFFAETGLSIEDKEAAAAELDGDSLRLEKTTVGVVAAVVGTLMVVFIISTIALLLIVISDKRKKNAQTSPASPMQQFHKPRLTLNKPTASA